MNACKTYTTIADLLTDEGFLAWHLKKDERQEEAWNNWMAEKNEHAVLAEQAVQVLTVFISLKKEKLPDYEVNVSFERLLKRITNKEVMCKCDNVTNVEMLSN